ncbi:GDP-mannose mannosyl hydrolase [Microbulbifer agarilyticus]|uniref:GDP-mannose mannosyl hydrolase n=1 Tax=Microbulbifer agarilyticus TaxID=260552 RepID=UPI001C953B1E|nr:GDP-mannose mannosyl hydrolase [Microbulbifer agarilyticus]MBY6210503.1 GDP-mannose mannosyl hydrolase [Microbulbifer agarilyticus]
MSNRLPLDTFETVVSSTPLVSIDLLVRNARGEVLLGERLNRPAQGYWFVPGGRIVKDESMARAFARLTKEELGISVPLAQAEFLGPFEHFYRDSFFGAESEKAVSTHYVVLGYTLTLDLEISELPDQQHGRYRWWGEEQLLSDPAVHKHSKWYLDASAQ